MFIIAIHGLSHDDATDALGVELVPGLHTDDCRVESSNGAGEVVGYHYLERNGRPQAVVGTDTIEGGR